MSEGRVFDEHLLARLESFSDLVFGFVVPMLATNLKVPASPQAFVHSRKDLALFAAGFLFLCVLWLRHHRMMRRYFVPDAVSTFLVFLILGTVALYSYPFQLYFRFPKDPIAYRAYMWGFAFLGLLYTLMALYAQRRVGASWTPRETREAKRTLLANVVIGIGMVAFPFFDLDSPALFAIPIGVVLAFRFSKGWLGAAEPKSTPISS